MKIVARLSLMVVICTIFAIGFGWFWSLGNVDASEDIPRFVVQVKQAPVELRKQNTSDWLRISTEQDVKAGDEIRTGVGGKAEIIWDERGVTRIDSQTALVLEEVPDAEHYMTDASIRLRVESGRVWMRVLQLLDFDSEVTVSSADVVATVRGTAFGFVVSKEGTDVTVGESSVNTTPIQEISSTATSSVIEEGDIGTFGKKKQARIRHFEKEAIAGWVNEQRSEDGIFDMNLRKRMKERLSTLRDGADSELVQLSTRLRLKMSDKGQTQRIRATLIQRSLISSLDSSKNTLTNFSALTKRERERALSNIEAVRFLTTESKPLPRLFDEQRNRILKEIIDPMRLRNSKNLLPKQQILPSTIISPEILKTDSSTQAEILPIILPIKPVAPMPTSTPEEAVLIHPSSTEPIISFKLLTEPLVGVVDQQIILRLFRITNLKRNDITSQTIFSVTPFSGSLEKNIFTPAEVGSYTVTGLYSDPLKGPQPTTLIIKVGPPVEKSYVTNTINIIR